MTATVEFEEGSLELPEDLVAIWKNFAAPLASTRKGTLRIGSGAAGLSIELDIPSTSWGDDIVTRFRRSRDLRSTPIRCGRGRGFRDRQEWGDYRKA